MFRDPVAMASRFVLRLPPVSPIPDSAARCCVEESARLATMPPKKTARFIEPMLLLRTDALPKDAGDWEYQLKLDGDRAIAFKTRGRVHLRSRNDNDFSIRYAAIVHGLSKLPDETVIDGEVVALDEDGRPSFSVLQNYGSSKAPVVYFVFDPHDARRSRRHEPTVDGTEAASGTQDSSTID